MACYRDVWIPGALRDWTADVRFAWRVMGRQRWFAVAAVAPSVWRSASPTPTTPS